MWFIITIYQKLSIQWRSEEIYNLYYIYYNVVIQFISNPESCSHFNDNLLWHFYKTIMWIFTFNMINSLALHNNSVILWYLSFYVTYLGCFAASFGGISTKILSIIILKDGFIFSLCIYSARWWGFRLAPSEMMRSIKLLQFSILEARKVAIVFPTAAHLNCPLMRG